MQLFYVGQNQQEEDDTYVVLDWRGVRKVSYPYPYIVLTLLNTTVEPYLIFIYFLYKNIKEATSHSEEREFF